MLILTRKIGEQVFIGKGLVQVKVLGVENGHISIGFCAPAHIDIDREEIYLKKVMQQKEMSGMGAL